jgi:hypothetical protein
MRKEKDRVNAELQTRCWEFTFRRCNHPKEDRVNAELQTVRNYFESRADIRNISSQ